MIKSKVILKSDGLQRQTTYNRRLIKKTHHIMSFLHAFYCKISAFLFHFLKDNLGTQIECIYANVIQEVLLYTTYG